MEELTDGKKFRLKKEIYNELFEKLESIENGGKKPQVIMDTLMKEISESKMINEHDSLFCDRTVIGFKNQILTCKNGHRFSSILRSCPDPKCRN